MNVGDKVKVVATGEVGTVKVIARFVPAFRSLKIKFKGRKAVWFSEHAVVLVRKST